MADLALPFGGDLQASLSGDLLLFGGDDYASQRVLRRLLTNPTDYYWHPEYGAGLPAFIGQPINASAIAAVTRLQMRLEPVVSQAQEPSVTITATDDGSVYETIQFVSTETGQSVAVPFNVSGATFTPLLHDETGALILDDTGTPITAD